MHLFCIGHKPMAFDLRQPVIMVSPRVLTADRPTMVVPDDAFGSVVNGNALSEYAQLFGLADALVASDPSQLIFLFQYRKFISLRPGPVISDNNHWVYACKPAEAAALFPAPVEFDALGKTPIIGQVWKFGPMAEGYAFSHHREDFAGLLAALAHVEGFDDARRKRFAECPLLIPAPSLGSISIGTFQRHIGILKAAWARFSYAGYVPREGHQRRVGGFLLERLHSFLICEEISAGSLNNRVHGHQIVVSETAYVPPTA